MKELILGGVRSGKSALAQQRAHDSGRAVIYVATATPGDAEMRERIARHQAERPADWVLVEEPVSLAQVLRAWCQPERIVVVDCLTLWLSNLLAPAGVVADNEPFERERDALVEAVGEVDGNLVMVSNEVGLGITPDNALARRFCDEAGRLHQALARRCDRVTLMLAGLEQVLKDVQGTGR